MSRLEFAVVRPEVDAWLSSVERCLLEHPAADASWTTELDAIKAPMAESAMLRVVLVGEWNAGKSTLVRALTGAEVKIDADVATTVAAPYEWNGVHIVDTPGVHSERDAVDHDEIARKECIGADLVLCVVTNELFSPRLERHFHFLVDGAPGLGLAGKLAVVVNKMDREANPDEVIVAEVDRAIQPHGDMPIFLCAAKKFVDAKDGDWPDTVREKLHNASRFETFVPRLDEFVRARGALGRLATPVQRGVQLLETAKVRLSEGDERAEQQFELIRRKRRAMEKAQERLNDVVATTSSKVRALVLKAADAATRTVTSGATQEQIELAAASAIEAVYPRIDELLEGAQSDLNAALRKAEAELREIDDSPLGISVKAATTAHAKAQLESLEGAPRNVAGKVKAGKRAVGDGLRKGLERLAKDPKGLRDAVLKYGHKLGKKFRPWEATKLGQKIASGLGKAAKAAPFVAAAVDFYVAYREEKEEAARHQHLAKARLTVMRGFRDQAELEVQAVRRACDEMLGEAIRATIHELDDASTAAVAGLASEEYLTQVDEVLVRGRALQARILG